MNGINIIQATTGGFIPELIIDGEDIIKAEFTPDAVFKNRTVSGWDGNNVGF